MTNTSRLMLWSQVAEQVCMLVCVYVVCIEHLYVNLSNALAEPWANVVGSSL